MFGLKISGVQMQIRLLFGLANSINAHFRLKIPPTHYKPFNQTKSKSKI